MVIGNWFGFRNRLMGMGYMDMQKIKEKIDGKDKMEVGWTLRLGKIIIISIMIINKNNSNQ